MAQARTDLASESPDLSSVASPTIAIPDSKSGLKRWSTNWRDLEPKDETIYPY